MFSPKVNFFPHSSTLKYFKNDNLWTPLAPLLGEIQLCVHWVFCRKFNSKQLLYEAFFWYNPYFLQCSAQNERLFANLNSCENYSNSLLDHSDVVIAHRATNIWNFRFKSQWKRQMWHHPKMSNDTKYSIWCWNTLCHLKYTAECVVFFGESVVVSLHTAKWWHKKFVIKNSLPQLNVCSRIWTVTSTAMILRSSCLGSTNVCKKVGIMWRSSKFCSFYTNKIFLELFRPFLDFSATWWQNFSTALSDKNMWQPCNCLICLPSCLLYYLVV